VPDAATTAPAAVTALRSLPAGHLPAARDPNPRRRGTSRDCRGRRIDHDTLLRELTR
jgi:hypothetical protein